MSAKLTKYILLTLSIWTMVTSKATAKTLYVISSAASYNPLYLQDYSLTMNPDNLSLAIFANVPETYVRDPWVGLFISTKNGKTNYSRPWLQYDVNVCQILGKARSKFLMAWVQNFWNDGNLPKQCPIIKGNYSWHKMQIESRNVPPFAPPGLYEIVVKIYFKKQSTKEFITNNTVLVEWK